MIYLYYCKLIIRNIKKKNKIISVNRKKAVECINN